MIDLYVILAMPFNSSLVVVIYIIEIPSFYFGNATYHDFSCVCHTMYIII